MKDGKIAAIGQLPPTTLGLQTIELAGDVLVSAGVTTVIDAGSTSADDIDDFKVLTERCKTRVHALLNISRIGLLRQDELANSQDVDLKLASAAIKRHPNFIVGIKTRMSGSVIGENGLQPSADGQSITASP